MPTYLYHCDNCPQEEDAIYPIGTAPRVMYGRCGHWLDLVIGAGVNIAPSALETRGAGVHDADAREGRWNQDIPAYWRMRKKGMQPPGVDGAAILEDKVTDQLDIDYGRFYKEGVTRERVRESQEQAGEIMSNGLAR